MPQAVLDNWEITLPRVPPRSRLLPLEPVGIGTAMVESMTGYVMRLAEAHAVPVGALINHELAQRKASTERRRTRAYCSLPYYANGSNQCAAGWVQALEADTYRTNLSWLTFLPLGESFCTRYFCRRVRAWCPACYEQWRTLDRTIYEPLLWSVRLVAVCSGHQRALAEICPHCQRSMKPVGSTSRTGYCGNCHQWLGVGSRHGGIAGKETCGRILSDSALWLTRSVEELISLMPRLRAASLRKALFANLRFFIDHVFGGYAAGLTRFTSFGASMLDYWLSGSFAPRLDQFLLFAERLRTPVAAFLLSEGSQDLGDWRLVKPEPDCSAEREVRYRSPREARRALEVALGDPSAPSLAEVARRLNYRSTTGLRRVSRRLFMRITQKYQEFFTPAPYHKGPRPRLCEPAEVRRALLQSLALKDPESVPSIAKRLGYVSSAPILEKFPRLCRLIHRKTIHLRKTRIRRMTNLIRMALGREDPITLRQLANLLGYKDKKVIQRYFPTFHAQLLAHRRACKQKMLAELKRQLQHWNRVEPPITLTKVCQELALSRSTVARKCPQECRAIALYSQARLLPRAQPTPQPQGQRS
jgi:AraC-like DNA-binding protein